MKRYTVYGAMALISISGAILINGIFLKFELKESMPLILSMLAGIFGMMNHQAYYEDKIKKLNLKHFKKNK